MQRTWKWIAFIALAVAVAGLAIRTSSGWMSPVIRSEFERLLKERYGDVKVGDFHLALFPRVEASAVDIAFKGITIRELDAHAGLLGLLSHPRHINQVTLQGLRIDVRPHEENAQKAQHGQPKSPFVVDRIVADGAVLQIISRDAGKPPLNYDISKLTLHSVGIDRPMNYNAELQNAKPPGLIRASGTFGPWVKDDPGATSLTGDYTFSNADLSVFKGIAGTLSSTGKFRGALGRIEADGDTDTPNFTVQVSGNPVHLKARYHAIIDGTSGNTYLQPVTAQFLGTTILCNGEVAGKPGQKGKTVNLDSTVHNGHIEDLLRLATKTRDPMTGIISFRSKIVIPPGNVDIARKLQLQGQFELGSVRFQKGEVQDKINLISKYARGEPEGDARGVLSALQGKYTLNAGVIRFESLSFSFPGANIVLTGTYGLESEAIDFSGQAQLDAKPSQMATGWKSVLLKAIDPLFKGKNGNGMVVPIHIGGSREHPTFGLKL